MTYNLGCRNALGDSTKENIMLNRALILLILPVFGIGLFASDDASFPPVVYKSSADLMAALAKSIETRADQAPSPIRQRRSLWRQYRPARKPRRCDGARHGTGQGHRG